MRRRNRSIPAKTLLLTALLLWMQSILPTVHRNARADSIEATPPAQETMMPVDAWTAVGQMTPGINIGNTLESIGHWETGWGNPPITREYVQSLARLGFKTVRLPVAWDTYADNGRITPQQFQRVAEVVNWITDAGMYCVVNIHWDGGWIDSDVQEKYPKTYHTFSPEAEKKFRSYWRQIASFFRGKDQKLIFEALNEESTFSGAGSDEKAYETLNHVNQLFVDTVRQTGGNNARRLLIIAGYTTDISKTCQGGFRIPSDTVRGKLLLSIHYYTPWPFVGMNEDASWAKMMPTWGSPDDVKQLNQLFDTLNDFCVRNDTPAFIGEFAVCSNKEPASSLRWTSAVANAAIQRKMVPVLWDTGGAVSRREPYSASDELSAMLRSLPLKDSANTATPDASAGAGRVEDTAIETTVAVDAGQTLRTMNPRRLGGTNVAMWYMGQDYDSPDVHQWMNELHAGYIRLPGGSWSNVVYWNGNGVRGPDGQVDPNRVGPDGYPAVDYSSYAPSFLADPRTLHPASGGWHGHVDVKTEQDFVQSIPGTEAMVCPNLGTGRPVDAAEWVKWANQKMGYNVHYWELGNELGGGWEPGNDLPFGKGQITAEMYTRRFNEMANAMRRVDPSIKIGGGAFAEQMLRDCGDNVNFVSIHDYPGSRTRSDAQMFADVAGIVEHDVAPVKKWIHQYQPQRENQIEIAYTEWNLGGGVATSEMFSGLWASIFLGELAKNGVDVANLWDLFSDLLFDAHDGPRMRQPEYDALWLWNNYTGDRLIPCNSTNPSVYTYASRANDAVYVMLINTDPEHAANAAVRLAGFNPAASGEAARFTSREYYWNAQKRKPQWSTAPRVEQLRVGGTCAVQLAPYSVTALRIPSEKAPGLSEMARAALREPRPATGTPALQIITPDEVYAGDEVAGDVIAMTQGSDIPYAAPVAAVHLTANGGGMGDSMNLTLHEAVGHFSLRPTTPGQLTITARGNGTHVSTSILVKSSVPRPVVFWDFTAPPVGDADVFTTDFSIHEDLTQRANRAVARIELPPGGVIPHDKASLLLKVNQLPGDDKLKKENIRGVIFDCMTSADFACDDSNARISVVMQSSANWWMPLGEISLNDLKSWKGQQLEVKPPEQIKAMPASLNIMFILNAGKPASGSIYFDHIGFLVR